MRTVMVFFLAFVALMGPAHAESLEENYEALLADVRAGATKKEAKAKLLQAEFEEVLVASGTEERVELVVSDSGIVAQAFPGRVVAVTSDLADESRERRLFVLGHELGHVLLEHFPAVSELVARISPEVKDGKLPPALMEAAKKVLHAQEFSADEFSARLVRKLGASPTKGAMLLMAFGYQAESLTHPTPASRVERIKHLEN